MLRSIWLFGLYIAFLVLGTQAPFVISLGYVWIDTFRPQNVAYIILNQFPVSAVMGAAAFLAYFVADRRSPPRPNMISIMQVMLPIWVTLTLIWAVSPAAAFEKWDWAFKTLVFAAFLPLVIRSSVQIEAFLQIFMLSLSATLVPYGAKIAISGGGYGRDLGIVAGNSGLSEGATLAAAAVMTIPILLYLRKHAQLVPKIPWFRQIYLGLAVLAVLTTIGSFQRTGLVGLVVLGVMMTVKSRHKVLSIVVSVAAGIAIAYFASNQWANRISTITTYEEDNSAMTRILVWRWTLDYILSHPLGGGFDMYRINAIYHGPSPRNPSGLVEYGRAFHSVYFEMLGEHGWIGLALLLGLIIASLLALQGAARRAKRVPGMEWCVDLASAVQISLIILAVCGAFIGIAFQPLLHYLFAVSVSVSQYVLRVVRSLPQEAQNGQRVPVTDGSWRQRAHAGGITIAGRGHSNRPL